MSVNIPNNSVNELSVNWAENFLVIAYDIINVSNF